MADPFRVQTVFLDIVGFTKDRNVDAQSDVVDALNAAVRTAVESVRIPDSTKILIPTGDGIAIALLNMTELDVHLRISLELLKHISAHNNSVADKKRQFEVRIGINENTDNVLTDINGRLNVAGAGISMAQRIMDQADGSQILVGNIVWETLRQREKYETAFRSYQAKGKHGISFLVHQFATVGTPGLNTSVPSVFAPKQTAPKRLPLFVALYMAYAILNRPFLLSKISDPLRDDVATVLLNFLAEDGVEVVETPAHEKPTIHSMGDGKLSFAEQYSLYYAINFWVISRLAASIVDEHLHDFAEYFELSDYTRNFAFVTKTGIIKVQAEWPDVATRFGFPP